MAITPAGTKLYNFRLPVGFMEDVVKPLAADTGDTMTSLIERLLRQWVSMPRHARLAPLQPPTKPIGSTHVEPRFKKTAVPKDKAGR